jgi:hypothetical protein
MRRLAVAWVALLIVVTAAGPALAADPPPADQVGSVWLQPGTGPLDGLGTFVYTAQPPAPGPAQGSLTHYESSLIFHLEDSSLGVLALGYKDGQKVAGFGILTHTPVSTVPYDWKYGHIYYLLTYRLSATQWGAWVYDWSAASWSLIAVQTVPDTTGRMLPESSTLVDFDGDTPAPFGTDTTCARYPRIDALFYAPMGWRGDVITSATLKGSAGFDGPCPSTTTTVNGWQWYTVGTAA